MVHVLPAQQEGQVPAPKNCPKPAQLPRPELQEDATEQEWAHWKVKWERYKRSSLVGMDKTMVVDHLWACCSKELEESIWKQTGKNVDTEQELLDVMKRLGVKKQNILLNKVVFLDMALVVGAKGRAMGLMPQRRQGSSCVPHLIRNVSLVRKKVILNRLVSPRKKALRSKTWKGQKKMRRTLW